MQSVKNFMRAIGSPNPNFGVVDVSSALEQMEYEYLANGYRIQASHYLGPVRDESNNEIGYRILYVLVKDEEATERPSAKK